MRNSFHDNGRQEQTLLNLQFLIQLQLDKLSLMNDDDSETARARAVLRQLMDMETALRVGQTTLRMAQAAACEHAYEAA